MCEKYMRKIKISSIKIGGGFSSKKKILKLRCGSLVVDGNTDLKIERHGNKHEMSQSF
jgi:hypothetical protein